METIRITSRRAFALLVDTVLPLVVAHLVGRRRTADLKIELHFVTLGIFVILLMDSSLTRISTVDFLLHPRNQFLT